MLRLAYIIIEVTIMNIYGLQKTTLLDYPGHVACTIFLGGCNFRCPYCHNKDLVLSCKDLPPIPEEEIFSHLKKRRGILDGVCITGGEPSLQPELGLFIEKIKELDFDVKLDTNGSRPDVLQTLCEQGLLDYIAMDIKHAPEEYGTVCNIPVPMEAIQESVSFLLQGNVSYEFRTTVVKELHSRESFEAIGRWIAGADAYYLQSYRESEQVIRPGFTACSREELEDIRSLLKKYISHVEIRGVEI